MSDFLTLRALTTRGAWHAALTLPLPPEPAEKLLDMVRDCVLDHIHELTFCFTADTPPDELRREMECATARLVEITLLIPAAHARFPRPTPWWAEPEPQMDEAEPSEQQPAPEVQLSDERGFGPWDPPAPAPPCQRW